jgi:enoyl-CoA hydratase/carnithine racemase
VSDEILTERRGRVLVITINRPESRNAVNLAVSQGLADAVDELDDSADLSVAVITGAGGNFCAGMDLKAFAAGEVVAIPGRGIGFTERPPRKPLISAVEGYALAGGTEVVLAERITANGPLAVATTKDIMVKSADCSEEEMWKKQLEHIIPIFTSNDAKEGAIAFAEKRAPEWTGI